MRTTRPLTKEEEAEVQAIMERIEAREQEEKRRAWWGNHPSTKETIMSLRRYRRLLGRILESVEGGKIAPDHCNYLANYLERRMIPYLEGVISRLKEKANKWQ